MTSIQARWRAFVAVALVVALAPALPATHASASLDDDAGSGGDAPGTAADALPLEFGTFEGKLTAPTDTEDWYRVFVDAPKTITMTMRYPAVVNAYNTMYIDLRTPDDRLAAWDWVTSNNDGESEIVVTEPGWWFVRVHTRQAVGEYSFTITAADAPAASHSRAGNGYVAFAYDVTSADGSSFIFTDVAVTSNGNPVQVETWQLDANGEGTPVSRMLVTGSGGDVVVVKAEGEDVQITRDPEGELGRWSLGFYTNYLRAGTHNLVVVVKGADAYVSITGDFTSGVQSLGFTDGNASAVHALRYKDLDAEVTVTAPGTRLLRNASADVPIAHRLLSVASCSADPAECAVIAPDGTRTVVEDRETFSAATPGTWRFTRDNETVREGEFFAVFATDVVLPTDATVDEPDAGDGGSTKPGNGKKK